MKRLAIIDGDIIVYKIASVSQEKFDFPGPKPAISVDPDKALREVNGYINDLADLVRADEVLVCLSDPDRNWRQEYWAGYKANRDPERRPELWQFVRDTIFNEWPCKMVTALEADDVLGITATKPDFRPDCQKVIVSEDKDLRCIPGLHFNPAKDTKIRAVSELEADRWFLYQALIGDPTDGYPGARGVGPKSVHAQAILAAPTLLDAWEACVVGYRSREPGVDSEIADVTAARKALSQARLARILRHGDYDYRARCPRFWTPSDPNRAWLNRHTEAIHPPLPKPRAA